MVAIATAEKDSTDEKSSNQDEEMSIPWDEYEEIEEDEVDDKSHTTPNNPGTKQ